MKTYQEWLELAGKKQTLSQEEADQVVTFIKEATNNKESLSYGVLFAKQQPTFRLCIQDSRNIFLRLCRKNIPD
jgi:hypothetical protein